MPSTLRELRQRRNSVTATMKITKAMELIAASRVTRAQQKAKRAAAYTSELVRAVSMVAVYSNVEHPLTQRAEHPTRAAVLVISSDRGLAGAYSSNVMKAATGLVKHLQSQGISVDLYTCGRKAFEYYEFREVPVVQSWMGFSEEPHYQNAHEIGTRLISEFLKPTEEGGVDEIHVVYTRFQSLVSQKTELVRLMPLEVVHSEEAPTRGEMVPIYEFEPDADTVLGALLPLYVIDRLKFMLREAAASELASRQQAMHSATDNAKQLIDQLTRDANQARQSEITQEINEIVGGAGALSEQAQES